MKNPQIDRLLALSERATAGPWDSWGYRIVEPGSQQVANVELMRRQTYEEGHQEALDNAAFIVAAVNFVRSNLPALLAERDAASARARSLEEALTPSGDTKAAYIGEFHMGITLHHRGQEDYRSVPIEWTTIKEIMAAIAARARLARGEG